MTAGARRYARRCRELLSGSVVADDAAESQAGVDEVAGEGPTPVVSGEETGPDTPQA